MADPEAEAARVARLFPEAWDGAHAEELRAAMAELSPAAVPDLDRALRGRSWGTVADAAAPELTLAATCHADGRVRERAVWILAARTDGREIPFLVVRLNDWVGQVRDAARAALRRRLRSELREAWIPVLPLVLALRDQKRADHAWLVSKVEDLLVGDDGRGAWLSAAGEKDRRVRRALADIASYHPRSVIPSEVSLVDDRDGVIAASAARAIARRAAGDTKTLEGLWRATNPRVRRIALEALLRFPRDGDALAIEAAFDSDRTVRELGRFELAKRGTDARALYRSAIRVTGNRDRVNVLRALADVAEEEDAGAFRALLADPRARLRALAVSVLARWDAPSLFTRIDDPSPRVVRAVVAVLFTEARLLDLEALWTRIAEAPIPTALGALHIATNLGPWRALEITARAAGLDRPVLADSARAWFSRLACKQIFAAPTPAESADLRATFAATRGRLDTPSVTHVEDSLRVFARRGS